MQVLVLAAPRNGVGRTTLVHRLARLARDAGGGPVVLLDAGPGGDLTKRSAEKPEADLIAVPWDKSCTGPEFQQLKARAGGLIVVDAPLPEAREAQAQALAVADLIAVVTRPREDDFAALGGVVAAVQEAKRPFVFLVNRAKRHGNMAAATAIALARYGSVCPVILPEDERLAPSLRAKVLRRKKPLDSELRRAEVWTYLAERLDAICGAAAAGPARDGRERRRFPRQDYEIGATFSWQRQAFACRIRNVSASGLAFTADVDVPIGTRLTIAVPYLGEFEAVSVHRDADCVGLRFVIDEWQQAGLVRDLAALVGPGGRPVTGTGEPREDGKSGPAGLGAGGTRPPGGSAFGATRPETAARRAWFGEPG